LRRTVDTEIQPEIAREGEGIDSVQGVTLETDIIAKEETQKVPF